MRPGGLLSWVTTQSSHRPGFRLSEDTTITSAFIEHTAKKKTLLKLPHLPPECWEWRVWQCCASPRFLSFVSFLSFEAVSYITEWHYWEIWESRKRHVLNSCTCLNHCVFKLPWGLKHLSQCCLYTHTPDSNSLNFTGANLAKWKQIHAKNNMA